MTSLYRTADAVSVFTIQWYSGLCCPAPLWVTVVSSLCGQVLDLVEALGRLPAEVRLPVLAGLPPRDRGLQLRRLTGYLFLQYTIHEQQPSCTDSCGEPPFFDLPSDITVRTRLLGAGRCVLCWVPG